MSTKSTEGKKDTLISFTASAQLFNWLCAVIKTFVLVGFPPPRWPLLKCVSASQTLGLGLAVGCTFGRVLVRTSYSSFPRSGTGTGVRSYPLCSTLCLSVQSLIDVSGSVVVSQKVGVFVSVTNSWRRWPLDLS